MGKARRIVITGIGVVSPIGLGKAAVWKSLHAGRLGFQPITSFDTSKMTSKMAAQVDDRAVDDLLGSEGLKNLDRNTRMALGSARLAFEDSGLKINHSNEERVGSVFGTANGSISSLSNFDRLTLAEGPRSVNPAIFPNLVMCSAPSRVAIRFGLKGLSAAISSGFSSGYDAVKFALNAINQNHVDCMVVGAVEEVSEQTFKAFYSLGLLSSSYGKEAKEHSAPASSDRNGFILGEGAVAFIFEEYSVAISRNAHIYAELVGPYENQNVAKDRNIRSYIKKIHQCTDDLLLSLDNDDAVDFISLGINSSRVRDLIESRWVLKLCEKLSRYPVASGIKSFVGETFSAGYGFQILGALFCMDTNSIYKTAESGERRGRSLSPNIVRESISRNVDRALVCSADMDAPASAMLLKKI